MKNYNHEHKHSGSVISGTHSASITVGELRDAIADLSDDAEIVFGGTEPGKLMFNRFKKRGALILQMEFFIEPFEG